MAIQVKDLFFHCSVFFSKPWWWRESCNAWCHLWERWYVSIVNAYCSTTMPAIFPSLEDWSTQHFSSTILTEIQDPFFWRHCILWPISDQSILEKPQNSWHHHFMIEILIHSLKLTAISPLKNRPIAQKGISYSKKTWLSDAFAVSCRVYLWMQSDARKDGREGFLVKRSENTFFPDKVLDTWRRLNLKIIKHWKEKSFELNLHEFGFKMLPSPWN